MSKLFPRLITVAACAVGGWLFAQEESLFERLDKNKDGFVTSDEVEGERKPLFERLVRNADKNKDGNLDAAEFAAGTKAPDRPVAESKDGERPRGDQPRPQAPAGNAREMFKRMDRNADSKLQKEELPERMREFFDRIDVNSDGAVDAEEFGRVAERFAGRPPEGAAGRPDPRQLSPIFAALDIDRNGELSAEEIANSSKSLASLDKNSDGKITRDELGPPPGRPNPDEMLKRFKEADKNGDGKLSKEEAPDRLKENFDAVDRNSDGFLDEMELKQMLQRLLGRP